MPSCLSGCRRSLYIYAKHRVAADELGKHCQLGRRLICSSVYRDESVLGRFCPSLYPPPIIGFTFDDDDDETSVIGRGR